MNGIGSAGHNTMRAIKKWMKRRFGSVPAAMLLTAGLIALTGAPAGPRGHDEAEVHSLIVQGTDAAAVAVAVQEVGGRITHELGIIRAVAADLTPAQERRLAGTRGLRLYGSRQVELDARGGNGGGGGGGNGVVETYYPTHLGADQLHSEGIDGSGVTIAVLDSGIFNDGGGGLHYDPSGRLRTLAVYEVPTNKLVIPSNSDLGPSDDNGHGAHVTSIAVSSRQTAAGTFNGFAPGADLVVVKAFDENGQATYADVIAGVDWVVAFKSSFGIRVLNCSFGAEPVSHYWDDPLNLAIMAAWQAGIVVVASAGNRGPDAMTINVPGNLPYVITVGAMTDNYTPEDMSDDVLASFSSAGPTVEGFVKPELVAPGGHVKGLMKQNSTIAVEHPEFHDGSVNFNMSGTSQAAAVVSGIAALVLQVHPQLSPDEVKWRLMNTARRADFPGSSPVYSVFQQGAGLVNAYDAVHDVVAGNANRGLDVTLDLLGLQHFGGPADAYLQGNGRNASFVFFVRDANGNPVEDDGYLWSDKYVYEDGFLWADGYMWADGFFWADGYMWADGYLWSDDYAFSDGFLWSDGLTEAMSIDSWVEQE